MVRDIYQSIHDTVINAGYSKSLSETLCAMMRYMKKNNLLGGCHAVSSALYVALSEQNFKTELCVGEVSGPNVAPFDHSWITIDGKIIDLACYMPLPNPMGISIASNPIVLSLDVVTNRPPKLTYGIETGLGFSSHTQQLLSTPFVAYLDGFPFEKEGLWTVIKRISPAPIDVPTLKLKYANVKRIVCKNISANKL